MGMSEYLDFMDYFQQMNSPSSEGGSSGKQNLLEDENALISQLTGGG